MSLPLGISEDDAARLRKLLLAYESGELQPRPTQGDRSLPESGGLIWGVLTSSISATTTLLGSPKTGTLQVYGLTSTGGTTGTLRTETVYHFAMISATTDRWTICGEDEDGNYCLLYQGCT